MDLTEVDQFDQKVRIIYPDRLLLRVEEAAELLRIARTLMYRLLLAGDIESVHVGRLRRVPVDAVRQYVVQLRAAAQQPA